MSISTQEKRFLVRVVEDSVECGFINEPVHWKGRKLQSLSGSAPVIHNSTFFCCLGGGGRDDNTGLFLALVAFAAAFFIGLFYTAESSRSALNAQHDLGTARARANPPPLNPRNPPPLNPRNPPPLNPEFASACYPDLHSNDSSRFDHDRRECYVEATILLDGRRQERAFAAVAQGIMTAGAGVLTIAILVALVTEPHFWTATAALSGGCAVAFGAALIFAKYATRTGRQEQEAAERISEFLNKYPSSHRV